jgi:uncharacterized protein YndB with AHSA1/START domain
MNPDLDLTVSRIIRAPRAKVWAAWTDPKQFAQWWVPAPARCEVAAMDLVPGGAFETRISEDGGPFGPHISGCFLAIEPMQRIVWTNALVNGWRPSETPFITAIIAFADHPEGTAYSASAMHKDAATRAMHEELGFADGWGQVTAQLARLVGG